MDKESRRLKYFIDRATNKVCELCGTTFTTTRGNKRFCSYSCAKKANRPKVQEHRCPMCGDVTGNRQTYCSDECLEIHETNWILYNYRLSHPLVKSECKWCGAAMYSTKRKFCSDKCAHLSMLEDRKNSQAVKEASKKNTIKHQEMKHINDLAMHREEALKKQEELLPMAIKKDMPNPDRYLNTLGIRILGPNFVKCEKCGYEFVVGTGNPDKGGMHITLKNREVSGRSPCPNCSEWPYGHKQFGMTELEIQKLFPAFTVMHWHPEWLVGQELDLYSPEFNVALEYHGVIWHSDYKNADRVVSKHKRKADLCEANGVQLIQVYETEWRQRREQVIDKLDAIFHVNMERRFARKLSVRELNDTDGRKVANLFMDENHIQGHASSQWVVGLFDGDEPMAVCCFKYGTAYAAGGQSKGTEKYWELNRYATKMHVSVVGGISRCVKAFERSHPEVKNIVSFADRRWTCPTRSAYSSSGFVETGRCEPNYQYTDMNPGHPLHNKQYMRKSSIETRAKMNPEGPEAKVFSWDKTETEMARELRFYRIYDAGKIRYEMKINQ